MIKYLLLVLILGCYQPKPVEPQIVYIREEPSMDEGLQALHMRCFKCHRSDNPPAKPSDTKTILFTPEQKGAHPHIFFDLVILDLDLLSKAYDRVWERKCPPGMEPLTGKEFEGILIALSGLMRKKNIQIGNIKP